MKKNTKSSKKCKICESENLEDINLLIHQGHKNVEIIKLYPFLSQQNISTHKSSHMDMSVLSKFQQIIDNSLNDADNIKCDNIQDLLKVMQYVEENKEDDSMTSFLSEFDMRLLSLQLILKKFCFPEDYSYQPARVNGMVSREDNLAAGKLSIMNVVKCCMTEKLTKEGKLPLGKILNAILNPPSDINITTYDLKYEI